MRLRPDTGILALLLAMGLALAGCSEPGDSANGQESRAQDGAAGSQATTESGRQKSANGLPVDAIVTFFYYEDLEAAKAWYTETLGFDTVYEADWTAIVEVAPGKQIGLVNATGGSLQPAEEKGALVSIETEELEAWYDTLKGRENLNLIHGIQEGGQGLIEEFRMRDPGGYIIEFFRWKPQTDPDGAARDGG